MVFEGQQRYIELFFQAQRIKVGFKVALTTITIDQLAYRKLLSLMFRIDAGSGYRHHSRLIFRQQEKVILDRGVRDVWDAGPLYQWQGPKVTAPLFRHFRRVLKILLIKFFNVRRIASGDVACAPHPLHDTFRHTFPPSQ